MAFPELAMSCTYRLVRPDRSLSLQGWGLIDLPLRALFQFLISFPGVAWSILDCARRTSTFLSCAFREQEDDQVTLPILRRPRVARAQKIISLHPLPSSESTGPGLVSSPTPLPYYPARQFYWVRPLCLLQRVPLTLHHFHAHTSNRQ